MIEEVQSILSQKSIPARLFEGILICEASGINQGFKITQDLIYELADRQTVLFLSGGRTPKDFYLALAEDEMLSAGAVALVDERFGPRFHSDSNEKMIKNSGLLWYLSNQQIPFYPILTDVEDIDKAVKDYDETVRYLLNHFPKSIGILGVGLDGHTAGLPARNALLAMAGGPAGRKEVMEKEKTQFVTSFDDFPGIQKIRVTMTFLGLSLLDLLLILVFGEEKKETLQLMFSEGDYAEVPARFFRIPEIAKKTLMITDQTI